MFQQDSYSEFMPLRQSSLLNDETLRMDGTDVYANVTVIWPAGHEARELELERARVEFDEIRNGVPYVSIADSLLQATLANSFASTISNNSTSTTQNSKDEINDETIWMTALDIPYNQESDESNERSMFEAFHSVLDFTLTDNQTENDKEKMDCSLNDTLPNDDEHISLDDSWEI